MSRGRKGVRGAAAGFALAAGMIYSRLGGREERSQQQPEPEAERGEIASSEEVGRARSELADELARRAALSER